MNSVTPAPSILLYRKKHRGSIIGCGPTGTHPSLTPTSAADSQILNICGFIPLPSITASPVCTTTSTTHLPDITGDQPLSLKSVEEFTTVLPSSSLSRPTLTPTWISTPPTPPPRTVRRSVTCFPRLSSPLPPSASFPASTLPHAEHKKYYSMKRCDSAPSMLPRQRASSDSSVGFKELQGCETQQAPTDIADSAQATFCTQENETKTLRGSTSMATRSRPIFHIAHEIYTDTEDTSPRVSQNPTRATDETSAEGGWSGNESDDTWASEKAKDSIRKYHALGELLATEIGYLLDLRALVTVYLRIIPTLTSRAQFPPSAFSRASSSFASTPWINSHSHVVALSNLDTSATQPLNAMYSKEQTKGLPRYLFTDQEVELLTRNAEEILQLHEQFVEELRNEMVPLGFPMEIEEQPEDLERHQMKYNNTDAAIRAVSAKFATEASRFNSYQVFCAGHPEALNIIRRVQLQHPIEWDAFEQRCSSLVFELKLTTTGSPDTLTSPQHLPHEEHDAPPAAPEVNKRSRTSSLTSVDGAARTLRSRASGLSPKEPTIAFPSDGRKDKNPSRLAFIDYMIKPVQRICKYPLVLDQLKSNKFIRSLSPMYVYSDMDVDSAVQAMKRVASSVDEARHRQDVAIQSALIISRISLNSSLASHTSTPPPSFQPLTLNFLQSLGTCLLAGSLDVIHYHAAKPPGALNISAKYLGAFLYLGYLILVKVSKTKIYEPRHWFSLSDFDISDIEDDAVLPCSFRLSTKEHQFELAAACQREKDVWLSCIRESIAHPPTWDNEPASSLRFDGKGELIPLTPDDGPMETITGLPTIHSIPDITDNSEYPELTELVITAFGLDPKPKKSLKQDSLWKQDFDIPSRRSSTASVKAIFSPAVSDSETIVIRRSSASARSRVDQGLRDIISQSCLTARTYASSREELLFQAPKTTNGFVRSHSGLSMAAGMAKSRLTRHESILVLRRKEGLDAVPNKKISSTQNLATRRRTKNLSITSTSECDANLNQNSDHSNLPSPFSPSSSATNSAPGSISCSPTYQPISLGSSPSSPNSETKSPLKARRSLVKNVKGLFHPPSPATSLEVPSGLSPDIEPHTNKTITPGSIKRWAKGSLHRRVRSAPEVPEEGSPPVAPQAEKVLTEPPTTILHSSNPRISYQSPNTKPLRRKSLLSPSYFRHSFTEIDSTRSTTKNTSLLQRLKA